MVLVTFLAEIAAAERPLNRLLSRLQNDQQAEHDLGIAISEHLVKPLSLGLYVYQSCLDWALTSVTRPTLGLLTAYLKPKTGAVGICCIRTRVRRLPLDTTRLFWVLVLDFGTEKILYIPGAVGIRVGGEVGVGGRGWQKLILAWVCEKYMTPPNYGDFLKNPKSYINPKP